MIYSKISKAFTLIELLVVIVILSVLISLFLPALSHVMENGRTTKCSSNLRQIGAAMFLYAGEHDGYLPLSGGTIAWGSLDNPSPAGSGQASWMEQLSIYMSLSGTSAGSNIGDPKLNPKSIFTCPSSSLVKPADKYYSYFNGAHAAYAINQATNAPVPWAAIKLQTIAYPSKHIISGDITHWDDSDGLNDADKDDYTGNPSPNPISEKAAFHNGKINLLFADGHVGSINWDNALAASSGDGGYFNKDTMATHYSGSATDNPANSSYMVNPPLGQ